MQVCYWSVDKNKLNEVKHRKTTNSHKLLTKLSKFYIEHLKVYQNS